MPLLRGQSAKISLDHMAEEDFELGFYQRLAAALRAAAAEDLESLHLSGLRACVMRLRGAKRWGASCRSLADDIVRFVRSRIAQDRTPSPAALSVEVTD